MNLPEQNGAEIALYFDTKLHALVSIRSNGVRLYRKVGGTWRVLARKKPDVPLEQWTAYMMTKVAKLAPWQRKVRCLPSLQSLMAWEADGKCKTPTGFFVEPDGRGADGVPSWLVLLNFI